MQGEVIGSQLERAARHCVEKLQAENGGPPERHFAKAGEYLGISERAVRSVVNNEGSAESKGRGWWGPHNSVLPSAKDERDADLHGVLKDIVIDTIAAAHGDGRPMTSDDVYDRVGAIVEWDEEKVTHPMFYRWMKEADFFYAKHAVGSPHAAMQDQLANIVQTHGFLEEIRKNVGPDTIIVFDDESYLQDTHARSMSYYVVDVPELGFRPAKGWKGKRWCFQAVLGPDGVVPGTYSRFEGGSGDYHASFDGMRYCEWFTKEAVSNVRKAYPNGKIVWITDSAAYHKVTRLALNNPSAPGKTPTAKKDYLASCLKLGFPRKNASLKDLKKWAWENYHTEPALPQIAFENDVALLYQPPSFSACNAIERVWAWVKNSIAAQHPPSTRSFTDLGEFLDEEMAAVTFKLEGGRIAAPERPVNFSGLYASTTELYRDNQARITEWLKEKVNADRFKLLDERLDAGRMTKQAEKEVRAAIPSPERPKPVFQALHVDVTPKTALRVRSLTNSNSVRLKPAEDTETASDSPMEDVARELSFMDED